MGVQLRIAVIIIAVHGGHIPPAVLPELVQISLQHGQMVQGKVTHAVELGNIRQQAVLRAFHVAHHEVQSGLVVPTAPHRAVVLLRHELLDDGGPAVDHAAVGNAALGIDLVNDGLGDAHIRVEDVPAGLELAGVRHDEVAGCEMRHVLVHVEAVGEVHRHCQQYHRQRQGRDGDGGLAPAAAQVGPGHGQQGHAPAAFFRLALDAAAFGVAHRLDGRDLAGDAAGLPAGEQHRHQREQRRADEDHRAHGGHGHHAVQL